MHHASPHVTHVATVHDTHVEHRTANDLKMFWVSLTLTIPIFFYSEMALEVFNIRGPEYAGWQYVLLLLGSIIYFYCGGVFLQSAYHELKDRLPGMMTLVAIAVTAAYAYSAWSIFSGQMHDLIFELASLITIMLLGHWIEMKSISGAQDALKELSKLLPDAAEVLADGATRSVSLSDLKVGDLVLVRPGAKVPADGMVVEGSSDVNESILTGESKPLHKHEGDKVIAGSINGDGSLTVTITSVGENTFLSGVMRLVSEAQVSKSRLQLLSDRAARYLTIIAIIAGGITFVAWLLAGFGVTTAVERLVAVLVITCPHALGLAVPLVAAISTTMAARNGLLVRKRLALEGARNIDTILFDKTGTLTTGEFRVQSTSSEEALMLAAAVEQHSQHPIGRTIFEEAKRRGMQPVAIKNFTNVSGAGAQADVEGTLVFVGQRGGEHIIVEQNGRELGTIQVSDTIRPEAKEVISKLKAAGIAVAMITGDSHEVAKSVAQELGIRDYFARVQPEEKAERVKFLQAQGKKVAMVGDGVNDAPALAQSDLGIAIGAGTNVAIESADIILIKNDPRDIPKIFNLSRLTYRKMVQNLFWATGYNVIAVPLAAGALAFKGIILQPWLAAVFMSISTVIVAINAVLLRNKTI